MSFLYTLKEDFSYFEEVLEVGLVVGFALQQGGGVELAGAEADVRLHVSELRRQQVSYQLNGHVLPSRLFAHMQSPKTQTIKTLGRLL